MVRTTFRAGRVFPLVPVLFAALASGCGPADPCDGCDVATAEQGIEREPEECVSGAACNPDPDPETEVCPGWATFSSSGACGIVEALGEHTRYSFCESAANDPCVSVWSYYIVTATGVCIGHEVVAGEPITICLYSP